MLADLRYGLRQLAKSKGFTLVAVLTLAFGIGVNTTMFTIVNMVLLREPPVEDSSRLVEVFRTTNQAQNWPHSPADFWDIRNQSQSFSSVAAYNNGTANLALPGQAAERLNALLVSSQFLTVFGVAPQIGRPFRPEEERDGAGHAVLLSDALWRSRFGGDPAAVGRQVRIDGQSFTIVGVMPATFEYPTSWGHIDLWEPFAYAPSTWQVRDNHWLQVIARLKPGVSRGQAQAELSAIAARLAKDHPDTDTGSGLRVESWNSARVGDASRRIVLLCMGLSCFVLVIACANLANLQLARASDRAHEHALRMALGASRLQLMRQFVVESLMLSLAGGAVGALIASWGTRLISSRLYTGNTAGIDLPMDPRVLAFTLVASVAAGVTFGTVPAWIISGADANGVLKQNTRGAAGSRSRSRIRKALIAAEMVMALTLLAGAGYFVRGMQRLATKEMGWKPEGLVTAGFTLPFNAQYDSDARCAAFCDKLLGSLGGLPGVKAAAVSSNVPFEGYFQLNNFAIEGRPAPPKGKEPLVYANAVSPGFFPLLGIRLAAGRDFNSGDRADTQHVAIVNQAMARRLWPGEDPIGKRIGEIDPAHPDWRVVVGVVDDVMTEIEIVRPAESPYQLYRPFAQAPAHFLSLVVQSGVPVATLGPELREAVAAIDPDQPLSSITSAPELVSHITNNFTLTGQMMGAFAVVGLVLSAVGLYGVIANLVVQRTAEIAIRMALGAEVSQVLWMVVRQGMGMVAAGTLAGLGCAWAALRVLGASMPSIPGDDPAVLATVVPLMVLVAMAACWLPAYRAARISPTAALRAE